MPNMPANKRNFMVGATVLAALLVFGWMFLRFGAKTATLFAPPQTTVEMDAPRVDGLSDGSQITYQGVLVGRVVNLERKPDGTGVKIDALLFTNPPVPANVKASIVTTNLIGGSAQISLELPRDSKTLEEVPPVLPVNNQYPPISAAYVGLQLNLLPSEYGATAEQITRAAKDIADAAEQIREQNVVQHLDEAVKTVTAQANRAGDMMQSFQDLIRDPNMRNDLSLTLTNTHKASDDLLRFTATLPDLTRQTSQLITNADTAVARTQGRIDEISKQLGDGLAKASIVLDDLHDITQKIDKGQGVAGQVLNDPRLYQNLLESSQLLNADLKDLQRLIQQWEQEGVPVKL
jgi:phospholipid/cholesterol/gamma-HCH transport system substrate-binding protein